jgi:nicotinate-nucleotide adenylyltransferase
VFYGGTFDPVHNGHLAIACAARDALSTDIRLLPAADPPHRPRPGASATDRAEMVRLAIADTPGLLLDLRELQREGRSWSIDTLAALRALLGPDAAIAWLVGADSFRDLPSWKDWRELLAMTHFVVAERAGFPLDAIPDALREALEGRWTDDPAALRDAPAGRVLALHQTLQSHSATQIRDRIAAGDDWRQLVPPAVAGYIIEHHLYGLSRADPIIGPRPGAPL